MENQNEHIFDKKISRREFLKRSGKTGAAIVLASALSKNLFASGKEEKGVEEDVTAIIPKTIQPRAINSLLLKGVLEKLKGHSVVLGDFSGGVQISMKHEQITIDISDTVVRELVANFIRRDFRDLVFQV